IPIHISYQIKNDAFSIKEYIEEIEPDGKIIRDRVLMNTIFEYKGHPFLARSASERGNAKQLLIPKQLHKLIYSAEKGFNYEEKIMDFEKYLNVLVNKLMREFVHLANSQGFIKLMEDNYKFLLELENDDIDHFIKESLTYFQVNTQNPNFKIKSIKDLKNKSRFGRMGNPIKNWKDQTVIIDQSITGYYESRMNL